MSGRETVSPIDLAPPARFRHGKAPKALSAFRGILQEKYPLRCGEVWHGKARPGWVRRGKDRCGGVRLGKARHGEARFGREWLGKARRGLARQGEARRGKARCGVAWRGKAWLGVAWHGRVWRGMERERQKGAGLQSHPLLPLDHTKEKPNGNQGQEKR